MVLIAIEMIHRTLIFITKKIIPLQCTVQSHAWRIAHTFTYTTTAQRANHDSTTASLVLCACTYMLNVLARTSSS